MEKSTRASDKSPPPPSDRSFGMVFAIFFLIVALWPLLDSNEPRAWALAVSATIALVALIRPSLLSRLNRAWMAFGNVMHLVVTPILMAVLFYLTVTPTAVLMRLMGKKPIPLTFDHHAKSYWIVRTPPGPPPESMKNQF